MADSDLEQHTVDGARLKQLAQTEFLRAMRTGRMIAFVGSYASEVFGYPKWGSFLRESLPDPFPISTTTGAKPPWIDKAYSSLEEYDAPKIENYEILVAYCEQVERGSSIGILGKSCSQFELNGRSRKNSPASAVFHLCNSLGIKRFITTNYDLEIEYETMHPRMTRVGAAKWFRDSAEKQRRLAQSQISQTSQFDFRIAHVTPDGRRIVSDIFHRERPDRLFQFAVGSPDHDIAILHLHGRVTDPQTMIVTQADYDRHYRRSGIAKLPFEHARNALFGGNPVVFVGLGMSEADFLTSLEQFVSDDRPGHLPPTFAIWNADKPGDQSRTKTEPRTPGEISVDNDLWRMRVYRKFGTLVLFDTEIDGFTDGRTDRVDKPTEVGAAVELLARFTQRATVPFPWDAHHFRSMKDFLPDPLNANDRLWESGSKVWPVDPTSTSRYLPDFAPALKSPAIAGRFDAGGASSDDYMAYLLRDGSPVKLVLDPPGTGHGYFASVLSHIVTKQLRDQTDYIYFQINAGFAWEIDTTFSAVSGLMDSRSAFSSRVSRAAALQDFVRQFVAAISNNTMTSRKIVIVINGADRFFDSNGYPLSNELDVMLRQLRQLFHGPEGERSEAYQTWVRETNAGHPATVVLLGTNRIGRYFTALKAPEGDIGKGEAGYIDMLGSLHPPFASSEPPRGFRKRVAEEYLTTDGSKHCPFENDGAEQSVYLSYLHSAFERRRNKLGKPAAKLGIAAQTLIDRRKGREIGNLRYATLEGYLHPDFLALHFEGTKKMAAGKAAACLATLKTMALIGQPTEPGTLRVAPAVRTVLVDAQIAEADYSNFIENEILPLGLITKISSFPGCTLPRYGLHRALLQDLRDRFTVPISDARSYASFNLPLLAAQPIDDEEPNKDTQDELEKLFDSLVAPGEWAATHAQNPEAYRLRLRAATASLRSYYTTSSLLMNEPTQETERNSARLSNHARRIEQLTGVAEKIAHQATPQDTVPPPFFPDDLVWLHDQRGVTLLAQGDLYGARDSFGEAERINEEWVEFGDHENNWRRIQINQLHVDIERGKLSHAEGRLRAIEQSIEQHAKQVGWRRLPAFKAIIDRYGWENKPLPRIPDPDFPAELILSTGLCLGYRAWSEQFQGRLKTAETCLGHAITIFRNLGEQRAYAMFLRHQASLYMALNDRPAADEAIRLCIAASDSVRQLDISHLAWLAKSDYALAAANQEQRATIQQQLNTTLRYANATHMHRVRMEARRSLAQLRFAQGDYDGALEQAADAVAVASRFGFSLRKISLRIAIGQILILRGDPVSGNAMIDEAARNADRIGYQGAVEHARTIKANNSRLRFS